MMPKVSIVIPCFNVERYVSQCVMSALHQSEREIEIICIDDGSTDSTPEILDEIAELDERVRVYHKFNSGYGSSMNCGLALARGEFISILESDDFAEPQMIAQLLRYAGNHQADVVKANFYEHWSQPVERDELFDQFEDRLYGHPLVARDEPEIFFSKPAIWSALYRKSFLDDHRIVFNETPGAAFQDTSFAFQVWLEASCIVLAKEAFVHYRQDNESSSVNDPGKAYCVCDEYARMERFVDEIEDEDDRARIRSILVRMKFDSYLWNHDRLSDRLAAEFFERAAHELRTHVDRGEVDADLFDSDKLKLMDMMLDDPRFAHIYRKGEMSHAFLPRRLMSYFIAGGLDYVLKPRRFSRV